MNNLEKIREYWNTRSEGYLQQIEKEREEHKDEFYKEYFRRIPQGSLVLDIGCGPGFFTLLLASLGMNVTAADYSEGMLEKAKDLLNRNGYHDVEFCRADAQHLPFADASFDAVVSRNLVWNLEDPEAAYKEWLRVLNRAESFSFLTAITTAICITRNMPLSSRRLTLLVITSSSASKRTLSMTSRAICL